MPRAKFDCNHIPPTNMMYREREDSGRGLRVSDHLHLSFFFFSIVPYDCSACPVVQFLLLLLLLSFAQHREARKRLGRRNGRRGYWRCSSHHAPLCRVWNADARASPRLWHRLYIRVERVGFASACVTFVQPPAVQLHQRSDAHQPLSSGAGHAVLAAQGCGAADASLCRRQYAAACSLHFQGSQGDQGKHAHPHSRRQ